MQTHVWQRGYSYTVEKESNSVLQFKLEHARAISERHLRNLMTANAQYMHCKVCINTHYNAVLVFAIYFIYSRALVLSPCFQVFVYIETHNEKQHKQKKRSSLFPKAQSTPSTRAKTEGTDYKKYDRKLLVYLPNNNHIDTKMYLLASWARNKKH